MRHETVVVKWTRLIHGHIVGFGDRSTTDYEPFIESG